MKSEQLLERFLSLEPSRQEEIRAYVEQESKSRIWFPTVGPQLDAVKSKADLLLYGGAGGAGKTDLILGLAFTEHRRTLVVRKHYADMRGLTDRAKEINTTDKGFNGSLPPRLTTVNERLIDFGGLAQPGDEQHWQGQPHDLLAFDEAVQLREAQVRFLLGWLRSADPKQRCRAILATNPPISSAGDWIIPMFAPWLDTRHPNPAKPGELRWVVTDIDGQDLWIDGPDHKIDDGRGGYLRPMSRTFIPGRLSDNPFLASTNYAATLDGLPEPLRSAIRDGNFMAARQDDAAQVIPTAWIRAAQKRWRPEPPWNIPMCAIGVDAARAKDETVLAPRYDGWYPTLITCKGSDTPHGRDVAALVIKHRRSEAVVVIDCAETNGAQAYGHLTENGIECVRHLGIDSTPRRTAEKQLGFMNKRAEVYWRFREALDPEQDGGSPIALPDDPMLVSDLTAPHWELKPNGIAITPKKELVKNLGRSPDRGDAVVMAWSSGPRATTHFYEWRADQRVGTLAERRNRPAVNLGARRTQRKK